MADDQVPRFSLSELDGEKPSDLVADAVAEAIDTLVALELESGVEEGDIILAAVRPPGDLSGEPPWEIPMAFVLSPDRAYGIWNRFTVTEEGLKVSVVADILTEEHAAKIRAEIEGGAGEDGPREPDEEARRGQG